MARQEKRTRIKGIPPRLYLQQKDARSGSYPSISRISSDNRTGNYPIFFDDMNTMVFTTASSEVNLGSQLPESYIAKSSYQEFGADITSSLSQSNGSIRKGVSDVNVSFTPGQSWQPYKEINQFAADAKSKSNNHPFYSTGSKVDEVGEGFEQPLWSKTSFEIDLTPSEACTLQLADHSASPSPTAYGNYPMGYWNKTTKKWEGIGNGYDVSYYISGVFDNAASDWQDVSESFKSFLHNYPIGFQPGIKAGVFVLNDYLFNPFWYNELALNKAMAQPMQNFLFPHHQKFHATASNLISMADYIDQPFILEKAVLIFSGAFNLNSYLGNVISPPSSPSLNGVDLSATGSWTTFFIMNQRDLYRKSAYIKDSSGTSYTDINAGSGNEFYAREIKTPFKHSFDTGNARTSTRDLVTWFHVVGSDMGGEPIRSNIQTDSITESYRRELNLPTNEWSGKYVVSGNMKSMEYTESNLLITINGRISSSAGNLNTATQKTGIQIPGRNCISNLSDRSIRNTFSSPQATTGSYTSTKFYDNYSKNNPYVLLPTDNLVFGWQVPTPHLYYSTISDDYIAGLGITPVHSGSGLGPQLIFAPAPSKIIFYGSPVSQGKENHDTLNQLLTSNTVHEVIGE